MRSRTVGVLAVLLSSVAACGSQTKISGSTEPTTTDSSTFSTSTVVSTTVPETSTLESSPPETTTPETTTTVAMVDERLVATPIDVAAQCSEVSCVSIAVTLAGEVVSFDSATRVITFVDSARTVAVDPSIDRLWSLAAMGPDDVAYINANPVVGDDPAELVAIATSGPNEGQEISRVGGLDPSGDSNLIATAKGVMQVGCCGFEGREPPEDTPLTMAWLTETGDPSGVVFADVHLEHPNDDTTVVVRTAPDGSEQRWTVTKSFAGRDMPPVVATDDGGALLLFYDPIVMPDTAAVLYDFRPDGSVDTFQVGPYRYAAAMHSSRFIITFNDGYLKLALP